MDRKTLIGLGLIGVILATFTFLNKPAKPTAEQLAKQKKELNEVLNKEKNAKTDKENVKLEQKAVVNDSNLVPKLDAKKVQQKDANGALIFNNKVTGKDTAIAVVETPAASATVTKGELVRFETDKLIFDFSTKGGVLAAVYLKEFQSYTNFAINKGKRKVPLKLFGENDGTNELSFPLNGGQYNTGDKLFTVVESTKNHVVFELNPAQGQAIQFVYTLKPSAYDMDFEVKLKGFAGKVNPGNVMLNWNANLKKTERLLSAQRLVSTICFKYKGEDHDWLSEATDDEEKMEQAVEWVAFKQSYFSTIMKPVEGFEKGGSLKIKTFKEGQEGFHSHIKEYKSSMNLAISNTGDATAKINWFFGPNDYEVLKSYNSDYEDIINYGWGLFRWINIYAIQPLFNLLAGTGLGFGIVILLVTLIIKLFLMPIQWKMYVSSAKMRILKPEVEALTAKYPNKEDAMKKQMEMMSLYRTSGASPLAGCVPMLIQMPILLAVFRFFPAAFELRQQPFLWAEDLSSYDSIYNFSSYIPLYGDHISLFTLLMAVTTLIYTWINSSNMQQPQQPGMPNMKIIMYIFPFMMIFFFNNYSSGLSYYYFISTLISILIMLAIKQFFVDEDKLKEKMAAKKAAASTNGPKKKSKFQERLEQMQKAQQEAQKKRK